MPAGDKSCVHPQVTAATAPCPAEPPSCSTAPAWAQPPQEPQPGIPAPGTSAGESSTVTLLGNSPEAEGPGVSSWGCVLLLAQLLGQPGARGSGGLLEQSPLSQHSLTQPCYTDGLLCNFLLSSSHVTFYGKNYSMCSSCLKWPVRSIQNKF